MTSGNLSDEPMAAADADALERLSGIADLFLAHDRAIENRCDDSVARVIAGSPTILRRARGYVPRPVALARPLRRPVLACGAQLKNTFCLAAGREAWLGPHVGDLDNLEAIRAFEEQVERLQRFLGIRPELIAHDLHPDYASTRYASKRPELLRVAVQHHHAHVASALAEHGLAGPVLGLAWDGTGYGIDGTAWGGELLRVTPGTCERLATLRPLRLAGGDQAIRDVWRLALAVLDDAFDGSPPLERLRLFDGLPSRDLAVVRRMLQAGVRSPLAHGAGRYFDAIGALGLGRTRASYEGQVALEWNLAAGDEVAPAYPFELGARDGLVEADLRPLVRAVVADIVGGVPSGPRLRGVPRDSGRRRGRPGPGGGRALGPAACRSLGRLLPERAPRRGCPPAPGGRFRGAAAPRRAAGGRRDRARPGARGGRAGRRLTGRLGHVSRGSGQGGRDLGRRASCAWAAWTSPA